MLVIPINISFNYRNSSEMHSLLSNVGLFIGHAVCCLRYDAEWITCPRVEIGTSGTRHHDAICVHIDGSSNCIVIAVSRITNRWCHVRTREHGRHLRQRYRVLHPVDSLIMLIQLGINEFFSSEMIVFK